MMNYNNSSFPSNSFYQPPRPVPSEPPSFRHFGGTHQSLFSASAPPHPHGPSPQPRPFGIAQSLPPVQSFPPVGNMYSQTSFPGAGATPPPPGPGPSFCPNRTQSFPVGAAGPFGGFHSGGAHGSFFPGLDLKPPAPVSANDPTQDPNFEERFEKIAGTIFHLDDHQRESGFGEHPFGEHPSHTLFVRNINSGVNDDELHALFSPFGEVKSIYSHSKHRGFVMVSYYDIRCAKNAMKHLQSKVIRRRKLDIHYSIPKENPSEKDQNQGTLVVFNLDVSTSNEELHRIFSQYGEVKEIRETPHKKHHKFIEFYDIRDAERSMKFLNKTEVKGKKIKIELSRPGGVRQKKMLQASGDNSSLPPMFSQFPRPQSFSGPSPGPTSFSTYNPPALPSLSQSPIGTPPSGSSPHSHVHFSSPLDLNNSDSTSQLICSLTGSFISSVSIADTAEAPMSSQMKSPPYMPQQDQNDDKKSSPPNSESQPFDYFSMFS